MSYLFRWVRQNQTLTSRSASFLSSGSPIGHILESTSTVKPLYQVTQTKLLSTTNMARLETTHTNFNNPKNENKKTNMGDDGIQYVATFKKGTKIKDVIKQIYSLYGPVFVVCHIGVSLTSLGFFCSLVMLSVDITNYIPAIVTSRLDEIMLSGFDKGGKFVIAYAIHKLILPLRLGGSLWLTRFVSGLIKARKAKSS